MLRVEDWDVDPWLVAVLAAYEKHLDGLLGADPTPEELEFEATLGHLDESLWLRLGFIYKAN